jgi:hypothetical protein
MGAYVMRDAGTLDPLNELGRATTAYHEAPPEHIERARHEYEEALRRFKAHADVNFAGE